MTKKVSTLFGKKTLFGIIVCVGLVAFIFDVPFLPGRIWRTAIHSSSLTNNRSIGKVFIAVDLYQSETLLRGGSWTNTMLELIDRLGPNNVYLSIFENNSTDATPQLLHDFKKRLKCNHTIVTTSVSLIHNFTTFYIKNDPHKYVSRIAYLASIRNRVLQPLLQCGSNASVNGRCHFSKLLFLNDVVFSSMDVLRLLHTNNGDYAAACALDFINPVKFYDTLATRDADGYSMGFIVYPFFSPGPSRSQLLRGDGLVQVKSCWSGMVAFDSAPFENGLQFRALNHETAWDASECCLIHADIDQPNRTFINSAVRVAYSDAVYIWQKRFAHFETLWIPIQRFVTYVAGLPRYNAHRTSNSDGGFCWIRGKMLLGEHGWRRSENTSLFRFSASS